MRVKLLMCFLFVVTFFAKAQLGVHLGIYQPRGIEKHGTRIGGSLEYLFVLDEDQRFVLSPNFDYSVWTDLPYEYFGGTVWNRTYSLTLRIFGADKEVLEGLYPMFGVGLNRYSSSNQDYRFSATNFIAALGLGYTWRNGVDVCLKYNLTTIVSPFLNKGELNNNSIQLQIGGFFGHPKYFGKIK